MFSNPLKVLFAGSLVVSGSAALIVGIIGEEKVDISPVATSSISNNVPSMKKDDFQENTWKGCSVYLVEKADTLVAEGRKEDGVRGRSNASKILKKLKNPKEFLNKLKLENDKFMKDIEGRGCKGNFKRMYIYQNGGEGIYSDDLQRKDGLVELGVNESSIEEL